jgi:hypothetical protein
MTSSKLIPSGTNLSLESSDDEKTNFCLGLDGISRKSVFKRKIFRVRSC